MSKANEARGFWASVMMKVAGEKELELKITRSGTKLGRGRHLGELGKNPVLSLHLRRVARDREPSPDSNRTSLVSGLVHL